MHVLLKQLCVIWTLLCIVWALAPIIGSSFGGTEASNPEVNEDVEAAVLGCCTVGSCGTGLIAWAIGIIPLGILTLVFRPTPKVIVAAAPD